MVDVSKVQFAIGVTGAARVRVIEIVWGELLAPDAVTVTVSE